MSIPPFRRNEWPTLGVELELQLVDAESMALRSAIDPILGALPPGLSEWVKPEFMQCYAEINSGVGRNVDDIEADLGWKLRAVEAIAARHGVGLFWAATHPFSRWQDQAITPDDRYHRLADLLGETVVRPVTFGLHVHVGVPSGDRAIRLMGRLEPYMPLLLALSANSPFWHGRVTGHHAHRIEMLEAFPTGGPPPRMRGWDDYTALLNQMVAAGFIESGRELWWDVRPNARGGTVEVRICDMPPDLAGVLGLTALVQCLVHDLGARDEAEAEMPEIHPLLARQNRWRACRSGLGAELVAPETLRPVPARKAVEALVGRLRGVAEELGCERHLEHVLEMAACPSGAERQLGLYDETGDLAEVVRTMLAGSRLGAACLAAD